MEVRGWSSGGGTYGLRVGVPNRDEFFRPEWDEIEIEIDGRLHPVRVTGGFWHQCPEVRSPIIRDWLRRYRTLKWPKGEPPKAELVPLGGNRFRLIA